MFLRRVFIQEMYVGLRLNNLSVFSMNSKEILSKALEKSIWSLRPVSGHISNKPVWEVSFLPGGDDSV